MPYCPNCRTEYRQGSTRCTDCDVELVDSLPEEPEALDDGGKDLVELGTFPNSSEAEMIQELLEDNGIQTVLRGEVDPIGVVSGAAPSTLLVERADLEEARKFYEDFFAGEPAEEIEDDDETEPQP